MGIKRTSSHLYSFVRQNDGRQTHTDELFASGKHNYSKRKIMTLMLVSVLWSCAATQTVTPASTVQQNSPPSQPRIVNTPKSLHSLSKASMTNQLSIEAIMADLDWIGNEPTNAYWRDDNQGFIYQRKRQGSPLTDWWVTEVTAQSGPQAEAIKVSLDQQHLYAYQDAVMSHDKQYKAWTYAGNLFVKTLSSGEVRQLSRDSQQPRNLQFLLDGRLSYQVSNAIFSVDLRTGLRDKLAGWQFADEPDLLNPAKDYIAQEQQKLIKVIQQKRADRQARQVYNDELQAKNSSMTPRDYFFPKGHETVEVSLSPNGQWLLLVEQESVAERSDTDLMPNYINEDGRIKSDEVRRRVADAKPVEQSLWLLDLSKQETHKMSYTTLPGYNDDVLAAVKQENAKAKGLSYESNRLPRVIGLIDDWYWTQSAIQWHSQGNKVAIMLAAGDNKDRWLVALDTKTKKLSSEHKLHDEAWINYKFNSFGWLHNSETLYYLSEESGYSQLYTKPLGGKSRAITKGQFEVDKLSLTRDDSYMYFKANIKHPGIYEIYRVALTNPVIEPLTDLNGMTDYVLSPDEQDLLLTHSKLTMPPELYVHNIDSQVSRQVTHTVSAEFLAHSWLAPDIVPIKSSQGEKPIYARVYAGKPPEGGAKSKAVIFSHGAGYLQNSHLGWSNYVHEFMFHNFLVQQGYVVLDMDYRASAGYGRDWRTAIYRQMGKPEIEDLRDGVNWLVANSQVDRDRIGTYGGSYGGFMTFMALFTAPDLFKAGAALRPVSDWAHYNFGYTSNILNTPDIDPIAYQRSSPIYFAEGLEQALLINAPMVDSNVFFQDTVRLVQRLIELEKANFETAIFPVESHGFVQASSWLDEYRRIFKLFESNL
jgi:dipeptidyl aminopeptidase/acylaminoacyl peptidase